VLLLANRRKYRHDKCNMSLYFLTGNSAVCACVSQAQALAGGHSAQHEGGRSTFIRITSCSVVNAIVGNNGNESESHLTN
jgi:hypothetical protein